MTQTPEWKKKAFTCPHCHTLSQMTWYETLGPYRQGSVMQTQTFPSEKIAVAHCLNCREISVWINKQLVYPEALTIEPNPDLPEKAKEFFKEAQLVIGKSPRASCAMLRLCLECLVESLGGTGNSLNAKIKSLQLPENISPLFEACRIYGNQAAHPGVVDFTEQNASEIARHLSNFINLIVAFKITPIKQANALIEDIKLKKANAT